MRIVTFSTADDAIRGQDRNSAMKIIAFVLASIVSTGAFAQTFPAKAVRIVAPFPPGGGADALARLGRVGT
jgi:tripartite-type tricarboxylate transporter receptor subunit TctC